eukprot:6101121-Alexandrium_andersonii.AAC.1
MPRTLSGAGQATSTSSSSPSGAALRHSSLPPRRSATWAPASASAWTPPETRGPQACAEPSAPQQGGALRTRRCSPLPVSSSCWAWQSAAPWQAAVPWQIGAGTPAPSGPSWTAPPAS